MVTVQFHSTRPVSRDKRSPNKIDDENAQKKEHKRRPHGNRNYDRSSVLELLWYYVRLEDAGNEAPISLSPLKPSGHYMYRTVVTICTTRFNIQQFYVLPTQCIYVFCFDLRTNSHYFPIQH